MALSTTVTRSRSRRRWNRVAAALVATTAATTVASAVSHGSSVSAGGGGGDDGVVIVDAGDPADRALLIAPPVVGAIAEIASTETFHSTAADSASGDPLAEFDASLATQQTVAVTDISPTGTFVTRTRLDQAVTDGAAEAILGIDFADLVGLGWDSVIAANGVLLDSEVVDNGRLSETARSMTNGVPIGMLALLPEAPVGTGAHWTIDGRDATGEYSYDCRLVEMSADRFVVEFDYRFGGSSFEGGSEVRASTVGHGDFDASLHVRLDSVIRVADVSIVTLEDEAATVTTAYTMVSTSRPLGP